MYRENYGQTLRLVRRAIDAAIPGLPSVYKTELAKDVVQDAALYVFFLAPRKPAKPAGLWVAIARRMVWGNVRKAERRVHDVNGHGPMPQTGFFPNQVFGCRLAAAFQPPIESEEDDRISGVE